MIPPLNIDVVVGTRPEVIKMAPVIHELKKRPDTFKVKVISSGQHRELLAQALKAFDLCTDVDLDLMKPNQDLASLTSAALMAMSLRFAERKPDLLLVQGDTTTVLASSLAAFYHGVTVGHVEAGLRSHDIHNPFPEEVNRRLTSAVTSLHFSPTVGSKAALVREGYPAEGIVVTGNTVVDALLLLADSVGGYAGTPVEHVDLTGKRLVLVTSHRRESFDGGLREICAALRDIAMVFDDVVLIYPLHPNPKVREVAKGMLSDVPRVFLVDPLDYPVFVRLMRDAHLILTDSGGIQEEAPTFDVPVLIMRKVTERPEAFVRGQARVVGTTRESIKSHAFQLLSNSSDYESMRGKGNPFGDGKAAKRIVEAVSRWAKQEVPLLPGDMEFQGDLSSAPMGS